MFCFPASGINAGQAGGSRQRRAIAGSRLPSAHAASQGHDFPPAGHAALEAAKRPLLISRYISAKASRSVAPAGAAPTADMIRIPGGTFRMGSDRHYPDEAPSHAVTVDGFWIDPTPVTNAQFRAFVQATN